MIHKIVNTVKAIVSDQNAYIKSISCDMFSKEDVENIEICNKYFFVVKFKEVSGTVPASFFTDRAKDKILSIAKIRDSKLWKTLNNLK